MHWRAIGDWLLSHGLLNTAVGVLLAGIFGRLLAWKPLKAHQKRQDAQHEQQSRIADLLDTETEGGLHDLLRAVESLAVDKLEHKTEAPRAPKAR